MYTLKGEIKMIGETIQVSDKFKKRDLVVTDASGQYAQHIQLQLVQDRTDIVDPYKVGDTVEVTFFLRGREWANPKDGTINYFNSLDAWKIQPIGNNAPAPSTPPGSAQTFVAEGDDDLPF